MGAVLNLQGCEWVARSYGLSDCHSFLVLLLISRSPGNEGVNGVHKRFE